MRKIAVIVLTLAAVACGVSSTDPVYGRAVELPMGGSVKVPGDTTTVRFTDVTSDSRCAAGVQCAWEGDAAVQFTVGGTAKVTLHTTAAAGAVSVTVGAGRMTLVSLAPAPKAGQVIARNDYVAMVRFDAATR